MLSPTTTIVSTVLVLLSISLNAQQQAVETSHTDPDQATTITVGSKQNLRIVIDKGFRIKGPGQAVSGRIVQPLYIGEKEVIAPGTVVHGHVIALRDVSRKARVLLLLDGDFTKPHVTTMAFDQLVGLDGRIVSIKTEESSGLEGIKLSMCRSKAGKKPSLPSQATAQVKGIVQSPNKLQKITENLVTSLPYHPEYIDGGTLFNATLQEPMQLSATGPQFLPTGFEGAPDPKFLHLRLLTPLNSQTSGHLDTMAAVVSEPFYDVQHHLLFPAGSRLEGSVTGAQPARWLHKQGSLRFNFDSSSTAGLVREKFAAQLVGIEAPKDQDIKVDEEGGLKATTPHLRQASSLLSLAGPSRDLSDPSRVKTAWSRSGQGRKGFGLLGSGAAQASASAAIGLGYYGAAKRVYASFIAKGTDVDLPVDTALLLDPK